MFMFMHMEIYLNIDMDMDTDINHECIGLEQMDISVDIFL